MTFKLIGAGVGGFSSAFIAGGTCFSSLWAFGIFLLATFVCMMLGEIVDNQIK